MGNLPCPMPADYQHKHSHLIFAIKHGKDKQWIESEIEKLRAWANRKKVLRLSWDSTLTWWLRKAIEFESEQAAGERAYGAVASPSDLNGRGVCDQSSGAISVGRVNRWFDRAYKPGFVEHMLRITMSPTALRQALGSGQLTAEAEAMVRGLLNE